ncbi:MAG TPA: hypothetical protein ENK84_07350 [Desulfobulbus sp.]|nr:hypothetical protein [Desulfobulbus sp.]
MKILIFGAGALGQALGCLLAADGHDVDLIIRKRFIDIIGSNGLKVTGIFGNFTAEPDQLRLFENIREPDETDYDCALITTKSYDTIEAVQEIADLNNFSGPVVSMQNGSAILNGWKKNLARPGHMVRE